MCCKSCPSRVFVNQTWLILLFSPHLKATVTLSFLCLAVIRSEGDKLTEVDVVCWKYNNVNVHHIWKVLSPCSCHIQKLLSVTIFGRSCWLMTLHCWSKILNNQLLLDYDKPTTPQDQANENLHVLSGTISWLSLDKPDLYGSNSHSILLLNIEDGS